MLLNAAGATRPAGASCTESITSEFDALLAVTWDIRVTADAEAMLACAMAATRIDSQEVARLARVVGLRDRIARERSVASKVARPAPLLPPRASIPNAGSLALGGISAGGIALSKSVTRAA